MSEYAPQSSNGHTGPMAADAAAGGHAAGANGRAGAGPEDPDGAARPPAATPAEQCRLTVHGPSSSFEVAVPVHVPLIDLLPALIAHLGGDLADAGLDHGGWVLQRLGQAPLKEDVSLTALGLHDGDVVHLRPRSDQLPPIDFDDLVDGVAVGISKRPDSWRPETTRRLLTGLLAVPLTSGLALLAGHPGRLSEMVTAALCLALLGLAAIASRAFADGAAAGVLAAGAIGYATAAGFGLQAVTVASISPHQFLSWGAVSAGLLPAGAAAAGAAALAVPGIGGRDPALVAATAAATLVAAGGALAAFAELGPAAVAAVVLALALPLGAIVPLIAFRLARLQLDPIPTSPDELQADLDPIPGRHVLERTRWADRYMSALYCGLALVSGVCLTVLATATGWPAHVVAIAAIALLLMHARVMVAVRHRLAAILPGVCGLATLITAAGLRADAHLRLVVLTGLVVACGLLFAVARKLPGHKLLPYWGRAGDILQSLAALALIPATLWLLNLYQFARSVHG
jgi:type VII secretion integral membrane protein EccD